MGINDYELNSKIRKLNTKENHILIPTSNTRLSAYMQIYWKTLTESKNHKYITYIYKENSFGLRDVYIALSKNKINNNSIKLSVSGYGYYKVYNINELIKELDISTSTNIELEFIETDSTSVENDIIQIYSINVV